MLHITCSGSPFEVGKAHGHLATAQIEGSLKFYASFFLKQTKKSWTEVQSIAKQFLPYLDTRWPEYVEEIRGVASGANVQFEDILALNVRTEIAFGLLSDGCTAFAVKTERGDSFIAQNWDWEVQQTSSLVAMRIEKTSKPVIEMITEAGIIGKIGLNDAGVGVTLNAIRAKGVHYEKIPCHLALRTVLECRSLAEARQILCSEGVASACHITIADRTGNVGLECTDRDVVLMEMDEGVNTHSNHLINSHQVKDTMMLKDSPFRLERIKELLGTTGTNPNIESLQDLLKDEKNYPYAICRASSEESSIQTLFSIVMDLKNVKAQVKIGRPTESGDKFTLRPAGTVRT